MRRFLTSLSIVIAATCSSGSAAAQTHAPASLAGDYDWGDGLGYNISLELREPDEYRATWRGCLGEYGTARGKWRVSGAVLRFSPCEETGKMKGHLRQARVTRQGRQIKVASEADDVRTLGPDGKSRYPISRRRGVKLGHS